jgi:carbon storage regulator
MLILSRYENQRIMVGDDIVLTVVEVRMDEKSHCAKVRIGIDAPRSLPVHREEIYEKIRAQDD